MPAHKRKIGFTLIELLVVISIVAILLSILLPALRRAKDAAQVSVCKSNLKQLGTAIFSYASSSKDKLPVVYYFGQSKQLISFNCIPGQDGYYCWPMYVLRRWYRPPRDNLSYVGWGPLWGSKMLETPNVFYCPALKGRRNFYSFYNPMDTQRDVVEPMREDLPDGQELLRAGYSYSPLKRSPVKDVSGKISYWPLASTVAELGPNTVLGADMLFTWDYLTHKRGSGTGQYANINILSGDGSVEMYDGKGILTKERANRWAQLKGNNIPTQDFFEIVLSFK